MEDYGIFDVDFDPGSDDESIESSYEDYGILEQECNDIFDENILIAQLTITIDPDAGLINDLDDNFNDKGNEEEKDFVNSFENIDNKKPKTSGTVKNCNRSRFGSS